ncbi:uncharacterized protein LOC114322348 [Camellia sinensis]|uniref:uncharacterized protein LOC114322348 n=1 Tax=Camellia sinensis TaxID=4442 RepID=UPI00103691E3|nr:uncharacterized protein LOC114322348 [Camellia sinensis]
MNILRAKKAIRATIGETRSSSLAKEFFNSKPMEFYGWSNPLQVDKWLEQTVKTFEVFHIVDDELRVPLEAFQLKGDSGSKVTRLQFSLKMRENNCSNGWLILIASFGVVVGCPPATNVENQDRKVSEFEQLKQENMSIAEYEAKFTELALFAPYMVDSYYKKASKFEGGLTLDVFDRVGVLKMPKYVDVLDKVLMAEANLAAMKKTKTPTTE